MFNEISAKPCTKTWYGMWILALTHSIHSEYMFSLFGFFIIARNQIDAIRTENALDTFAYKSMINFLYKYLLLVSSVKFVLVYTVKNLPKPKRVHFTYSLKHYKRSKNNIIALI